ncbi:uncharacterized protein LOC142330488 [Lycorma delicatula]|uniref:uncharacterized protein LOC142330488 n=1 Tax=Lycorma delicatula TaxID=130591 RepID=UPI003F510648
MMEAEEDNYNNTDVASEDVSNPQLPSDLVGQTDLLKGDAIGNTLYSERFVLKTLMTLSQIAVSEWTEDFENDLCYLWDMTIEHDVVKVLMKHDFLKLSSTVLQGPLQEPRFIEIVVGILRNMCCFDEVRQMISERPEMTQLLMQLLTSSDTLTLIQLVRLLHTFAWDLVKQEDQRSCTTQKHWLEKQMDCQHLCDKLSFLLNSSTNDDLLYGVLDVLNTLCIYGPTLSDKDFSQYFATTDMVNSLLECWQQLFLKSRSVYDDIENEDGDSVAETDNEMFLSKHMFKAAKKWIAVLASFAGHDKGREALASKGDQLSVIMLKLLKLPDEDERCEEMLTDIVNVLEALISTNFFAETIKLLLSILYSITQMQGGDIAAVPEKLTLIESFENYFESCVRNGSKAKLSEALDLCDDHLVLLFWTVIRRRDQELMSNWKSDIKPFDERSI